MFSNIIVVFLLAASTITAAPAKRAILQPWQVTSLTSFSPSGRPESYPWLTITTEITDPNSITLGTGTDNSTVTSPGPNAATNCQAKWYTGTSPLNHIWPCNPTEDGHWYMEVKAVKGQFSNTNFNLKFTRKVEVLFRGEAFRKTFSGKGHFDVPTNLGGTCGGSGVCSWGLKNGPLAITQSEVVV
ncbi:cell death in tomato 1 [Amniculicola lignicola CBS 123094]|uniref:Cell death in tomato 1 n=1 Tax=Amniculicola lignicola CBS 123094 TaxID=1392246 RepID=A0A6A5X182_9PLEO|nr:cell death in tomato 1 [Amniculicola lignicola CBS 123094]